LIVLEAVTKGLRPSRQHPHVGPHRPGWALATQGYW